MATRSTVEEAQPAISDSSFRAVFDSAPDAYLLLAPDAPRFTMLAANEARLRVTMRRLEDVIDRPLFEVFPDNPADPGATGVRNLEASLREVLRTGKPHRMPLQKYDIRKPDGEFEERYWDPLNSPVFDDRGTLIGILHRVEDVTEQVLTARRLERVQSLLDKLRESEERYRLLVNMIPQNIWTTDAAGQHTYFSRRWYEFTGATEDDSHGEGWMNWIHPEDRERTLARWHHSLETGEPYEIEYRFRDADGEYRWFLGKAMPLRNAAGEIVEWFGTATDISERKQLDEARERLLARERKAREQVTTILESITDAFFAVDREWRFTYVNREAERLLKRPRQELVGRKLWEEFSSAPGNAFGHEYQRAVAEQQTVTFEAYSESLGIWLDVRAYPSEDGLSVFFRDITARKRAEEKLRASEGRYRLLADMIPQHIWTTDPQGYHRYFSRRWFDYTGASLHDTEGEGWLQYLHPEDRDRTLRRWQESLRTGAPYSIEYRFRGADGCYRWFMGQATPLRDEAGNIVEWFGTLTDISERKRLEEERERLLKNEQEARAEAEREREELEQVTRSRERLMRGFSHDLKNPLGAADGHAQLLEAGYAGDVSEEQRDSIVQIRRSIRSALGLIEDLLQLAKTESGQIEVQRKPVDLREAVRDVADSFRAQCEAKGLAMRVELPEEFPTIETDAARVKQVLGNLVSNAIKYTPAGEIGITMGFGDNPASSAHCIAVNVSDTGPGIPEEKRHLVFQEFVRLQPEMTAGAGIGLTISRRVARALGGDITFRSKAGHGTTFTLWLPPPRS
jgi:PAS domain S-box-containing protein